MALNKISSNVDEFVSDLVDRFEADSENWNTQKEFYPDNADGRYTAFSGQYYGWRDSLTIYTSDVFDMVDAHGAAILILLSSVQNPNENLPQDVPDESGRLTYYLNLAIDILFENNISGFYDKLKAVFFGDSST